MILFRWHFAYWLRVKVTFPREQLKKEKKMRVFKYLAVFLAISVMSDTGFANSAMADQYHKHNGKRIAKPVQQKLELNKRLEKTMKPVRQKMLEAMQTKSPGQYQKMVQELKQINTLKNKDKMKKLKQLSARYQSLIDFGKKAVASEAKKAKAAAQLIAKNYGARIVFVEFLTLIVEWLEDVVQSPSGQVVQDFTINGNYDFEIEKTTGHLVALDLEAEADLNTGVSNSSGHTFLAGSFTAEAGVAKLIDVPAGIDKVHIQFTTQASAYNVAFADLALSYAGTDIVLEVLNGEFDQVYCSRSKNLVSLFSPVLYLAQANHSGPESITCEIPTNGNPQSLLVSSSVITYGTQALLGVAGGNASQAPAEFRVQFID